MIYLPIKAGGETERVGGQNQVPALFGPTLQVIGSEGCLSMKPPPLLKLFLFKCVEVFPFKWQSTYPDVLSKMEVPLRLME
jgi:hypothetical protein